MTTFEFGETVRCKIRICFYVLNIITHSAQFNVQMRWAYYEMAIYKGTKASNLCKKSMHTLCRISELQHQAEASTIMYLTISPAMMVSI